MATLQDYRDERLKKLDELKELGVNSYPAKSRRTHQAEQIISDFEKYQGESVVVAGRVTSLRKFGRLAFIVIKDFSGSIQLFITGANLEGLDPAKGQIGLSEIRLLDTGDFVEAHGKVIKTKTGETSVEVNSLRLLAKALRPMPLGHEEFSNKEERFRRRYIDINVNRDVRDRFVRRSKFWQATRDFLLNEDFLEISVPVLEHTTGGADATPFVTHMEALDEDFYLRISHELPLKRLIGAGYEKVFDIGPRFRNENFSEEHLPEHVAMEWYWAYADWEDGMEMTQRMIRFIVDQVWGSRKFTLANGQEIDFGVDGEDFERISFVDIIKDRFGIDVFDTNIEEVSAKLRENEIEVEKTDSVPRGLDKLWKKIRKEIAGPVFLIDTPVFLQPLAKKQSKDPRLTDQFNLVFGGTEACKAYSELNDPVDQLGRFVEQQELRDSGDDEAMMLDIDFVEMLEYGMPPTCGYGHSERVFWLLEGVTAREGVPFPQMRSEIDQTTKSIYPNLSL